MPVQTTSDRLPPADPVPLAPDADTAAVLAPVDALLAAIGAHDPAAALRVVRAEGSLTVAAEKPDGSRSVRRMGWSDFAAALKPGPEPVEERLTDRVVEIDGDIALVWAPYRLLVGGKLHHCGVNHFDLVRESGAWKILNVTYSQRTTGCE